MLAAHKILIDDLEATVADAYTSAGPVADAGAGTALAATLEWFAADPAAARFIFVELSRVGPAFRALFQADFARFTKLLDEGLEDGDPVPALTAGDRARGRRRAGARLRGGRPRSRRRAARACCPSSPTRCSFPSSAKRRPGQEQRAEATLAD